MHLLSTHSQELWRVSIFWLLSSNHFTDFNPLYALVLERNSSKSKHAGKTHLLTLQNALFVSGVVKTGSGYLALAGLVFAV